VKKLSTKRGPDKKVFITKVVTSFASCIFLPNIVEDDGV
jgi:hypothetical protein